MPIDVTRIPALEYELEQAKGTKGGGQPPNKERVAAIEEQLALHRAELERVGTPAESEAENASNVSTDYSADSKSTAPEKDPEPSYSPQPAEKRRKAQEAKDAELVAEKTESKADKAKRRREEAEAAAKADAPETADATPAATETA